MSYWTERIQKFIDKELGNKVWSRFYASLKDKIGRIWICGKVEPNSKKSLYTVAGEIFDKYPPVKVAYLNDLVIENTDRDLKRMEQEKKDQERLDKLSREIEDYVVKKVFPLSGWQKPKFVVEKITLDTMCVYGHLSGFGVTTQDYYDLGLRIMRKFEDVRHTSINGTIGLRYWATLKH